MTTNNNPVVETDKGKIRGEYKGGLYVFKGIPYAAPPIGELRWMPPAPRAPWSVIYEAKEFSPIAPQNARGPAAAQLPGFDAPEPQSEDCLYLNIWTPGLGGGNRPVMVWIHGGGFTIGSGSQPTYRGDILASRGDVVLVTINFRIGLLGYLNLSVVTGGGIPATGNEGLLDQIFALKWIRENISAFGGNPGNVTVFGESSGAMSIGCLMAMPKARGFFHKAIMESGTGHMARPLDQCVEMSKKFLNVVGLKSTEVKAMRSLSVEQVLAAQQELTLGAPGGVTPVAPVIDGEILPEPANEAIKHGSAAVPIIIGNNLEETKIFNLRHPEYRTLDEAAMVRILQGSITAKDLPRLIETYRKARSGRGEPVTPPEIYYAISSDVFARIPITHVAEAQCRNGQAAYCFIFTWRSPAMGGMLGACHALEIGFVFGKPDAAFCGSGPEVDELSRKIQDAWLAFARTGNPNCESLGEWPPYCDGRKTMMLGRNCHVETAPFEEERRVWETLGDIQPVI